MPLQRGDVRGFNFDRMVVEFTMLNQDKEIQWWTILKENAT